MNEHFYAAIMAGGGGTRLWPLSRRSRPKQSLSLFSDKTLFQVAVDRIRPLIPLERIFVMTGYDQVELLRTQCPDLPHENYLLEPAARGTAAAIGLAAIKIEKIDPEGTMACLTADHFMRNESEFRDTLHAALIGAQAGGLFTLGIVPTSADPSYGYIHKGSVAGEYRGFRSYVVNSFKEKPDLQRAKEYVESGEFLWNSGMFIWRVDAILEEIQRQLPDLYSGLRRIQDAIGKQGETEIVKETWGRFENTTIDYGVMEGAREVYVVPAGDLGWVDVGDWGRLFEILADDDEAVIAADSDLVLDSSGSLILRSVEVAPDKLIAAIDVEDLVIIETQDVLLICKRQSAERVKSLVEKLNSSGMDKYL
jgi:mannose-1-phosphate guanylyltransferase